MIIIISVGTTDGLPRANEDCAAAANEKAAKVNYNLFRTSPSSENERELCRKKQKAKEGSIIAGHLKSKAKITRGCLLTCKGSLISVLKAKKTMRGCFWKFEQSKLPCKLGQAFQLDPSDKGRPESRSLPTAHSSAAETIFVVPNLGKGNPLLSPITQSDLLLWGKNGSAQRSLRIVPMTRKRRRRRRENRVILRRCQQLAPEWIDRAVVPHLAK